jgi:transcriptional antiterminator NusG
MAIFALHIKTGTENKTKKQMEEKLPPEVHAFSPERELIIRKKGKNHKESKAMFPGYLFLEAEEVNGQLLSLLKSIPGFYQVLPSNKHIEPIPPNDLQFLNSLFNKNYIASISKASFDENNKIQIISGPLKGKEGMIIKVDRRKGRAKIIVKAFEKEHYVDLGFEVIAQVP